MSISKTAMLPRLFGVAALTLTLALTGCGQAESETTETEEVVTETTEGGEVASDEIVINDQAADATEATKTIVNNDDTAGAADFDALPTKEDEEIGALESSDMAEGDQDESKVPSNTFMLTDGGIQMYLPSSWLFTRDADGFVFATPEGRVTGYMYSSYRQSNAKYDLEAYAKSVPSQAASKGWKNIEVLGYETIYSSKGTLCSTRIMYSGTVNGVEAIHYVQFILSKSYLNVVEFVGDYEAFVAYISDIEMATDSIAFDPSEVI